jgi:hypothetical protein
MRYKANKLTVLSDPESVLVQSRPYSGTSRAAPNINSASEVNGLVLVGDVVDTHHPELKGYIFIRWLDATGTTLERWLQCVAGTAPLKGDRVLLLKPANWPEMVVTAVLETPRSDRQPQGLGESGPSWELGKNEHLRVIDNNGNALMDIFSTPQGPAMRLIGPDLSFSVTGKLRLRAEALELEGGSGGINLRTEADAVIRGRYIRLN